MRSVIPLIVSLGSLAAAINITSPAANETYAAGSTVNVKWTSVDTDPTNISLYLWNFVSWPPSYVPLAYDVPSADLSYEVQIPCDTNPEWGYQISAINGTNVYIIYAQSAKFSVSELEDGADCACPEPEPTPSTCPSAVSTVYVTVSPTGSSSRLFHPSSSSHVSPTPSTTPTSKSVKPGTVPKTIGWCSDYSHPVTLDKVPTPTPVADNGKGSSPVVTPAPDAAGAGKPRVKTITTTVTVEACPVEDDMW